MRHHVHFVFDTRLADFGPLSRGDNFRPTDIGNLLNAPVPLLSSGGYRFEFPPSIRALFKYENPHLFAHVHPITDRPEQYIFAIGVGHSPEDWANDNNVVDGVRIPTVFELLDEQLVYDLRNRKAMLLLDQSYEGYHQPWLWEWFHNSCEKYNIPHESVIYVTGNLNAEDEYVRWKTATGRPRSIRLIQSLTLDHLIMESAKENEVSFEKMYEYKESHIKDIKLYDCINKRDRRHRVLNYLLLNQFGLLEEGLVSMNTNLKNYPSDAYSYGITYKSLDSALMKLPLWIDGQPNDVEEYSFYANRVQADLYKRTWLSIVTESSYFKEENSIFISEKTLKPITSMQPFIVLGSRYSLAKLRELGYETFHPFIDESYDEMGDETRMLGIIVALEKLKNVNDKLEWYRNIRSKVEYNHNLFWKRAGISIGKELSNYWGDHFG